MIIVSWVKAKIEEIIGIILLFFILIGAGIWLASNHPESHMIFGFLYLLGTIGIILFILSILVVIKSRVLSIIFLTLSNVFLGLFIIFGILFVIVLYSEFTPITDVLYNFINNYLCGSYLFGNTLCSIAIMYEEFILGLFFNY